MEGVEVVRVESQRTGVMVQAGHNGSVGFTVNASEGPWTFGGTFWLTVEESDRLAEVIHQIADHARKEMGRARDPE